VTGGTSFFLRRAADGTGALGADCPRDSQRLPCLAREGADSKTLRRAVGHVPYTAQPGQKGNAVFAGHRDTCFRKLQHVRSGERIVVTTTDGRYEYVARETRVVKPRDVWVLDPTEEPTLAPGDLLPLQLHRRRAGPVHRPRPAGRLPHVSVTGARCSG
jgi:LPXTG-site transpeptidase (sortase) family protein